MACVLYQVFVDRFAASRQTEPRHRAWHLPPEEPPRGCDHYGGDLDGVVARLDHVQSIGCDALYLTPIFRAPSNHKYDTADYDHVDEALGGDAAFARLADAARARGLGLILDGVFNHVGDTHPWTRERRHYFSGSVWRGYRHLPELDLSHAEVDAAFFGPGGVVARWTRRGATGWRLDCANDLGLHACARAKAAALEAGACDGVIGELMAYPTGGWHDALDGVMNYWLRQAALALASGRAPADAVQAALDRLAAELAAPALHRSWNVLSSHDTPRLATQLDGDEARIELALALAFAYPGVPMIYYGEEIGMTGGADPANRAGMIWDEARWNRRRLEQVRTLARLKREQPALRDGAYVALPQPGSGLVAFARVTGRPSETVIFVGNARPTPVRARLFVAVPMLFDAVPMHDLLDDCFVSAMEQGCLDVALAPHGVRLLSPREPGDGGYRFFK
jgi:alpha-glucosidase